jgi:cytidyltransferase-like protein
VLLTDGGILQVYFNPDTNIALVDGLLAERNATQRLPKLQKVVPISQIAHNAQVLGQELCFQTQVNLFAELQEKSITELFRYRQTCLGGTFDHMHLGHKLLLTQACLLTSDTLHVGVTGDALLQNKQDAQFIEPYAIRAQRVKEFTAMLTPHLRVEVFQLDDPVGRVGSDPQI